jgi:hypothetical protein
MVDKSFINKTEQLDLLFEKWESFIPEYKGKFVKDGIVNEQEYSSSSVKILFIAKEPNNPNQEPWDYREIWNEGFSYTFASRIAEWSYGILNNFPQFDQIDINENSLEKAIKKIAFMNIKKSGGKGSSELQEMMHHLKINLDFLHKQIDIILPDIIILGTTWMELRNKLLPNTKWVKSGYNIEIGKYKNYKVIDFYHPSSRSAPSATYSLLQNIYNSEQFNQI